ncbi:MFS transporter [Streptomyces sp. NPDC058045]|uniref:MFS transporter n=1 Tax=Streptomyces sp. NPDC058045 TaxID=3346311 RepID=UPI0036EA91B1
MAEPSKKQQRTLYTVLFGQFGSSVGGEICWFAITLWAWQETDSATTLSFLLLANLLPGILLSAVLGIWVDRFSAKLVMLLCDGLLGAISVGLLTLYLTGSLHVWHLYVVGVLEGFLEAVHWLAYSKVVTTLAKPEQLPRANAVVGLADSAGSIVAPMIGGVLLHFSGLWTVLLVDLVSYLLGFVSLALARVPRPAPSSGTDADSAHSGQETGDAAEDAATGRRATLRTVAASASFILRRPLLRNLLLVCFALNFVSAVGSVLAKPLLMLRTGDNTALLGTVSSAGGVGSLLGGLCAAAFLHRLGRTHAILGGMILACLLGPALTALGQDAPVWIISSFLGAFLIPTVLSAYQSLWQTEVPLASQARIFGVRRSLVQAATPLGLLLSGLCVDLLGSDPTTATALVLGAAGLAGALAAAAGYLSPSLRAAGPPAASAPADTQQAQDTEPLAAARTPGPAPSEAETRAAP